MPADIKTYRKRPIAVEAVQLTESNLQDVALWISDRFGAQAGMRVYDQGVVELRGISIGTLAGDMRAWVGDYIVRGALDEFYPCTPDIFDACYEVQPVAE